MEAVPRFAGKLMCISSHMRNYFQLNIPERATITKIREDGTNQCETISQILNKITITYTATIE